jgi:hypothetical protein
MDHVMKLVCLSVPISRCQLQSIGILETEDFGGVYRKGEVVVSILAK